MYYIFQIVLGILLVVIEFMSDFGLSAIIKDQSARETSRFLFISIHVIIVINFVLEVNITVIIICRGLRPIRAWAENSERPTAMIYSDLFSLLFCKCLAVVGVSESLRGVSFELLAFCFTGY